MFVVDSKDNPIPVYHAVQATYVTWLGYVTCPNVQTNASIMWVKWPVPHNGLHV